MKTTPLDRRIPLRDPEPTPRDPMPLIAWSLFVAFTAWAIYTMKNHP